ncbi:MAG: OsmC family protein [Bacteroidota bacterium]|jgi:putative redox protein|nr:OsmC family protein [Chitinophagaceae bacterium]MCE2758682.1 OsmC family protein [Chitinophagaceae bacterium]
MALIEAILADDKFGMDIHDADGHVMRMDIPIDQGGSGSGFRPMQSLLAALCGCSSVDIISILKKQRQELTGLKIEADGSREEGKEPSLWKEIQIDFKLEGEVEASKAKRAVDLSLEKYCSVAETLRKAGATINYTIYLNGSKID